MWEDSPREDSFALPSFPSGHHPNWPQRFKGARSETESHNTKDPVNSPANFDNVVHLILDSDGVIDVAMFNKDGSSSWDGKVLRSTHSCRRIQSHSERDIVCASGLVAEKSKLSSPVPTLKTKSNTQRKRQHKRRRTWKRRGGTQSSSPSAPQLKVAAQSIVVSRNPLISLGLVSEDDIEEPTTLHADDRDELLCEDGPKVHEFSSEEFPGYRFPLWFKFIQRAQVKQESLTAAVVFYAYVLLRDMPEADHGVLDTISLKACHARIGDISVWETKEILEQCLLDPGDILLRCYMKELARICERGPLLVTNFVMHSDFLDSDKMSFRGVPQGVPGDPHTLILVGAKKKNGVVHLLLQLWSREKQFVEVDETYFRHCGGQVFGLFEKQKKIREKLAHVLTWA